MPWSVRVRTLRSAEPPDQGAVIEVPAIVTDPDLRVLVAVVIQADHAARGDADGPPGSRTAPAVRP